VNNAYIILNNRIFKIKRFVYHKLRKKKLWSLLFRLLGNDSVGSKIVMKLWLNYIYCIIGLSGILIFMHKGYLKFGYCKKKNNLSNVSRCISIQQWFKRKENICQINWNIGWVLSFRGFPSLHSHDQVNILVEVKKGLELDWMFFIAWVHRCVNHCTYSPFITIFFLSLPITMFCIVHHATTSMVWL